MFRPALIILALGAAPAAHALTLADASGIVGNTKTRVAGVYSASRIVYEVDGLPRMVDRRIVGAELSHGIASVDVFAQIGVITTSLMQDVAPDGDGFVAGVGFRAEPFHKDRTSVLVDALYTRQTEKLTGTDDEVKVELETYDVHTGVTLKQAYSSVVLPYLGVEVVPSDGGIKTTKTKVPATVTEAKMQRNGILSVRAGCIFQLTTALSLRPEFLAGGEKTVSFSGGYAF